MSTVSIPGGWDPQPHELPASILSKAFEVLGAFGPDHRVLTLSEIARHSGLPKSTVHRLLGRLVPLGMVEAHGAGFKIGLRLRSMVSAMPIEGLRQSSLPHLASLHRWSGCHVHLAALRGDRVVFVERFLAPGSDLPSAVPGSDFPAHATAIGKALLAHVSDEEVEEALGRPLAAVTSNTMTDPADLTRALRDVRTHRVAHARGESHPDLDCVAAPVIMKRRSVGAVSVSLPAAGPGRDGARYRALVDAVGVTAERIGKDIARVVADGHEDWFPARD